MKVEISLNKYVSSESICIIQDILLCLMYLYNIYDKYTEYIQCIHDGTREFVCGYIYMYFVVVYVYYIYRSIVFFIEAFK